MSNPHFDKITRPDYYDSREHRLQVDPTIGRTYRVGVKVVGLTRRDPEHFGFASMIVNDIAPQSHGFELHGRLLDDDARDTTEELVLSMFDGVARPSAEPIGLTVDQRLLFINELHISQVAEVDPSLELAIEEALAGLAVVDDRQLAPVPARQHRR